MGEVITMQPGVLEALKTFHEEGQVVVLDQDVATLVALHLAVLHVQYEMDPIGWVFTEARS